MRRITSRVMVMAAMVACLCGAHSVAYAQDLLTSNIPFKFTVGNKTLEPGKYQLRANDSEEAIEIHGPGKNVDSMIVMTRLSSAPRGGSEGSLVFDKVGDQYFLSEMWVPGTDGYLLYAAKGKHTHEKVPLQKGGK